MAHPILQYRLSMDLGKYNFSSGVSSIRKIMEPIMKSVNFEFLQTFEKQQTIDGESWLLNDISEKTKKEKGPTKTKIMVDTGNLSDGQWFARLIDGGTGFEIGSGAEYAQKHNLGKGRFPARKFAFLSPEIIKDIENQFAYELERLT